MGFTPAQVDDMTIAEYFYVCRGWRRAHESTGERGSKGKAPPMDREAYERVMSRPPPDWKKIAAKMEAQRNAKTSRRRKPQINGESIDG